MSSGLIFIFVSRRGRCRGYLSQPLPSAGFPGAMTASARLALSHSVLSSEAIPLSVYENIINRRRFIVKRKAPEIPHNYSWVLLGQNKALSTNAGRAGSAAEGSLVPPLDPLPSASISRVLISVKTFFLIFREFYSVMGSPTVRTLSFCILTCASICVVSHVSRLPYAVAMKSFASWRIICRAVS